ncbi:hypothetical protein [Pantoea septica]|uniref:glycine-rich domain-containing protein n=1 Tax=Pantoea septica TaxID=472695 RepID=UPI0028D6ED01|nr:hypothetical protein [Pantoea septica]
MHRIDTSTAQVDKFGSGKNGFTGGNPQTGELPTALDADFFDSVQEEIARVIESAGLALDKNNNSQLLAAIKALVSNGRLLAVKTLLTSTNYTPSQGTKFLRVKAVAGGGASGSEAATSGGNGGMSQGGYYGQYIDVLIPVSAFNAPVSIVIGSGGTPAAAGQNAGGAGGATSFGAIFTLPGGPGGVSMPLSTGADAAGASLSSRPITSTITPINSSGGITKASTTIQVVPGTNLGQMPLPSPIEGGYYGSGGIGVPATTSAVQGNSGVSGIMIIEEYA